MNINYEKTIQLLQSQSKFQIKPGLERIAEIMKLLENPQEKIKIIHIAGTNGKGSVCAILSSILTTAGFKTGLYTSPHLVEYTERIKINNKDISKSDFSAYVEKINTIAEQNHIDLTEFEILTAVAYLYFAEQKVDFAIIETGLGGRFDATNICKNPLMSVITSISFDHTDRLGNTIEKIAYEKSGIIKDNSTVITASSNQGFNTIKSIANEKNAKLETPSAEIDFIFENNVNYAIINNKKYEFPLMGLYQKENLALAIKAIEIINKDEINENTLTSGLKNVNWHARFQYIKERNILIDGAHNPDGAKQLSDNLNYYFPDRKKIFIYSTINTKDYINIAKTLFKENDEIYYLKFTHKNAVPFEKYKNDVTFLKNIKPLEQCELNEILNKEELKVITGSLYMIGEIFPLL